MLGDEQTIEIDWRNVDQNLLNLRKIMVNILHNQKSVRQVLYPVILQEQSWIYFAIFANLCNFKILHDNSRITKYEFG